MAKSSVIKNQIITGVIIALIVGFGGGYFVGTYVDDKSSETSHRHEEGSASHDHSMFKVSEDEAPSVELNVEEDAKSGWNISLNTDKFTFKPENVNDENVVGEGHAHLYVDGKKVARLYSPNFHYDENFDGTKTFRVTLNANDHSEYTVNDEVIETQKTISHSHDN